MVRYGVVWCGVVWFRVGWDGAGWAGRSEGVRTSFSEDEKDLFFSVRFADAAARRFFSSWNSR